MRNDNVRWFYVPARRLREYLAGRPPFRNVTHYVTGENRGKAYKPNGNRECARRVRQMGGASVQS